MSWSCPRCITKAGRTHDQDDSVEELSSSGHERAVPVVEAIPNFLEMSSERSQEQKSVNINEKAEPSISKVIDVEESVLSIVEDDSIVRRPQEMTQPVVAEVSQSQETELEPEPTPCLLYTSPSPRDKRQSRMPSSA